MVDLNKLAKRANNIVEKIITSKSKKEIKSAIQDMYFYENYTKLDLLINSFYDTDIEEFDYNDVFYDVVNKLQKRLYIDIWN